MDEEEKNKLITYAGSLIDLWLNTADEEYPLDATLPPRSWITPLGMPVVSYWARFNSKDELWGRIQMIGHLLGAEKFKGFGESTIEVQL
jgi:hypothetical protein